MCAEVPRSLQSQEDGHSWTDLLLCRAVVAKAMLGVLLWAIAAAKIDFMEKEATWSDNTFAALECHRSY